MPIYEFSLTWGIRVEADSLEEATGMAEYAAWDGCPDNIGNADVCWGSHPEYIGIVEDDDDV